MKQELAKRAEAVLYPADMFATDRPKIIDTDRQWLEFYRKGRLSDTDEINQKAESLIVAAENNVAVIQKAPAYRKEAPKGDLVRKRIRILDSGATVEITFPYNRKLVDLIRALPYHMRNFDNERKRWIVKLRDHGTVSLPVISDLNRLVEQHGFGISNNDSNRLIQLTKEKAATATSMAKSTKASHATDAEIDVPTLNGELLPFQRAGVYYAAKKKRTFIADEMGLGKTVQAIATIEHLEAYPTLIVVPAALKMNWMRELGKWIPQHWASTDIRDMRFDMTKVLVISYGLMRTRWHLLEELEFKAVIFDESHKLKNMKTKGFKTAYDLMRVIRPKVRLCLTGTPVENAPEDYLAQLKLLDRVEQAVESETVFLNRFCYRDWTGKLLNLSELNLRLRSTCMIRRRKADVLKELPDKRRVQATFELDNRKEYDKAKSDLVLWLRSHAKSAQDAEERVAALDGAEALTRIGYLKRIAAKGKAEAVYEWIEDFIESGEKLIVFAHLKEMQRQIFERFKEVAVWTRNESDPQEAVDRFQNEEGVKVIVCSQSADQTGLTLTASSNVLHTELWWNPSVHDQCDDRAHRIGQKDSVTGWYAVAKDTIEEDIYELIESKREMFEAAVEGDTKNINKNAVKQLVSRLLK